MDFKHFNSLLVQHVKELTEGEKYLFVVDVDSETLWDTYLNSFPSGTNEVFRERREYDCSCCRHFLRDFGAVVAIEGTKIKSIWGFDTGDEKYQPVVDALRSLVLSRPVKEVFIPVESSFGTQASLEYKKGGGTHTWYHFFAEVSSSVKLHDSSESIGSIRGEWNSTRGVLERSFKELTQESVETVLDLIAQKSLYKGEEWSAVVRQFLSHYKRYHKISGDSDRANYCWRTATHVGAVMGKIKNHSIGVLLSDISEGVELDEAVRKYEAIVAPTNYKRPKEIFTKRMVGQAQDTVKELGLEPSLGRRFAQLSDITVNNVLFADRDAAKNMSGTENAFEELAASIPEKPKNFGKVEEVGIETFLEDVLPSASEVEVLLDNDHVPNMVSLIAPKEPGSASLFKWDNGFSWAYSGNITDSMKERVKSFGGKVDGVLRFSIQWNDEGDNPDDLDAHCMEPCGNLISFPKKRQVQPSSGMLDVDIMNPRGTAVENITWSTKSSMGKGKYLFLVHDYHNRGARSGFTAEIEFQGKVHSFSHPAPLRQDQKVKVAEVMFDGVNFELKELMPSTTQSREVWGLTTNKFHRVSSVMFSPNYWDDQKGIGHRHCFFMIEGCLNSECPNGFFNEFLPEALLKHKRVFEALGSKMRVEDADKQLSGVGFSLTKRAPLMVKIKGSFERLIKVVF